MVYLFVVIQIYNKFSGFLLFFTIIYNLSLEMSDEPEKVNIEFGLVALAHNLRKMAANTPLSGPYNVALSQTGRCRSAKYPLPSIPKITAVRYIIGIHIKVAA